MQKLKILQVESSTGLGGQEFRTIVDTSNLNKNGHEVLIVCPKDSGLFNLAKSNNLPVCALKIERKTIAALKEMFDLVNLYRPDVILSHSSTDSWLVFLYFTLFARTRKPKWIRYRHLTTAINWNPLTTRLYRCADSIVCTSPETSAHINEKLNTNKSIFIPTGIDSERFRPASDSERLSARQNLGIEMDAKVVSIVATLRSWKGHTYLIKAFKESNFDTLIIAGAGPKESELKQLVVDLNLGERVKFTGFLSQPECIFWASDIYCQPSIQNEAISQSILQAIFCNIPVITTRIGGLERLLEVNDPVTFVPPCDALAIERTISYVLSKQNDPQLRHQLARLSKKFRARYSSSVTSRQTYNLLRNYFSDHNQSGSITKA